MSHINVPLVHSTIYHLTSSEGGKNWQKLLAYGQTLNDDTKRKFLWFWPTEQELHHVHQMLHQHGISRVLSIGCGSGLLEWLLRESASDVVDDFEIFGLEIDSNWWRSAYAIKQFIDLNFVDNNIGADFDDNAVGPFDAQRMRACCKTLDWQFALLFCYFNNRTAFLHYLSIYEGDVLLIIGPQTAAGIHTEPEPLQPNIPVDTCGAWQLCDTIHFGVTNVLAVYKRVQC